MLIIMAKGDGSKWAKKTYWILSIAVVLIVWLAFFFHYVVLGHSPVEANWTEEVLKWVVMTPVLVGIVDVIAYALIGTIASRKEHDLE